jgi:hypothetical protein
MPPRPTSMHVWVLNMLGLPTIRQSASIPYETHIYRLSSVSDETIKKTVFVMIARHMLISD